MSLFRRKILSDVVTTPDVMHLRRTARILVIDDDRDAFPIDLLKREGYSIDHWPLVTELRRLEQGDFDVIFLDIHGVAANLGQADGIGILGAIKRTNPHQIVVAFSGQSFDLSKMDFWKGADAGLKKPVDFLTAKETIDRMLSKLTVEHYWKSICALLSQNGVPEAKQQRVEAALVTAIEKHDASRVSEVLRSLISSDQAKDMAITLAGRLCANALGLPS